MAFEKHRDETRTYELDFADDLATSETISSITTAAVRNVSAGVWTDVTSEFGALGEAISGTAVQFTLNATAAGDQLEDVYQVYIEIVTSDSLTKVGIAALTVSAKASTT